ncbi:MAG: hypothetical protein JNN27_13235, partial [Planctomycetes bacterium]|nr:hypothetical protein [Planctomycetota bacterium]
RIDATYLFLIALAGCRAEPARDRPHPHEAEVARPHAVQVQPEVTLNYLRTENRAALSQPAHYVDVFELHNHTDKELQCTLLSDGLVLGITEVRIPNRGWREADAGRLCLYGARQEPVKPGGAVILRSSSWLRPSRLTLRVGEAVVGYESRYGWTAAAGHVWDITSDPFDSSLAVPGAAPVLTWNEDRAGDE